MPFHNEVLPFVGDGQLDAQEGMGLKEFRQARNDVSRAVDDRHRDAQRSTQGIDAARGVLGILDISQHFARTRQEQRTGVRDRDAARGPQQQLDAEPRLQVADDARHRGLRQAELARGLRKAAALCCADEHSQFLQSVTHSKSG
ncbi:hypothetical protein ACVWZR_004867 [Bradyrhizobium sp. i1.3.1]